MERDDRWTHLVSVAFRLDEAQAWPLPQRLALAAQLVESAGEVFPATLDPLSDFEGYAVRRLVLALKELLEDAAAPR